MKQRDGGVCEKELNISDIRGIVFRSDKAEVNAEDRGSLDERVEEKV